jgi:Phage derived protein Gp49-like (DUF891)
MSLWTFYDYVELTGSNPIREWLDGIQDEACAKIDYRLLQMAGEPIWRDKWISRYRGTKDLYEFRITCNNVQYRPLGTYFGKMKYIILAGAIEKGKIPKSDIDTAERRLANARKNEAHIVEHKFDDEGDLEEDDEKDVP